MPDLPNQIESPAPSMGKGARGFALSPGQLLPMLFLAVIWGLSIPLTKLGLQTLPPLTLTALRFGVAVPLLLLLTLGQRLPARALPRVAALGILGISIGQIAQTFGINGTTASVGTIISATIPVFVVVFAALRLGQSVTLMQKVGLFAAFAGIAMVAMGQGPEASSLHQTSLAGAAWMLLSALSIAFYYVWSVELTAEYGTAAVAAWSTLFGLLVLLPWTAWEAWHIPITLTAPGLGVAVYLGLAVTVAGLFLWLRILRTVPASVAAGVQYLQPVIGMVASAVMFGDRLGILFLLGVALILAGLGLTVRSPA